MPLPVKLSVTVFAFVIVAANIASAQQYGQYGDEPVIGQRRILQRGTGRFPGGQYAPNSPVVVQRPYVSEQFVPNPPIAPATIELVNTHRDPLVVQIGDRTRPEVEPRQIVLQPGESAKQTVERDTGGRATRVWTNLRGQPLRVLSSVPTGPRPLYDISVYEYSVTSVYYDRTLKGPAANVPQEITRGLKSIGVFTLPPGESLQDGDRIDVFPAAKRQGNPGAVVHFPKPY